MSIKKLNVFFRNCIDLRNGACEESPPKMNGSRHWRHLAGDWLCCDAVRCGWLQIQWILHTMRQTFALKVKKVATRASPLTGQVAIQVNWDVVCFITYISAINTSPLHLYPRYSTIVGEVQWEYCLVAGADIALVTHYRWPWEYCHTLVPSLPCWATLI